VDEVDRKLLNVVQRNFPVDPFPCEVIGREVGLSGEEVLERLKRLKEEGIIRRIGAVLDPRRLGWISTLCAARVPGEEVEKFVAIVNSFPGVTHNYERQSYYNIWFTLSTPSPERIKTVLNEISEKTGVDEMVQLPARKIFKVQVSFSL
jgi:DNA-binding Lrp family transcriptional regulator